METLLLKDFYTVTRHYWKMFIVITLVSMLIAVCVTYLFPRSYSSSIDIYVRHKSDTSTQYFTYDGYYETQASLGYTDTVAGYLQALSTLSSAAEQVALDPSYKQDSGAYPTPTDPDYLASFQKNITVRTVAPQIINVVVKTYDPVVSNAWARALGNQVTTNLKTLNQNGDPNFYIDVIHAPITETIKLTLWLDVVIGCIVGIVCSFIVGFILESNKKEQ